jgi:hypothetical protein
MGGYSGTAVGNSRVVHLGPLYYGQPRDFAVPINIPPAGDAPYLTIQVQYVDGANGMQTVTRKVSTRTPTRDSVAAYVRSYVVAHAMSIVTTFGEKMSAQNEMGSLGDFIAQHQEVEFDDVDEDDPRLVSLHSDVTGRMSKAVSTKERFKRWGKHYLFAIIR